MIAFCKLSSIDVGNKNVPQIFIYLNMSTDFMISTIINRICLLKNYDTSLLELMSLPMVQLFVRV